MDKIKETKSAGIVLYDRNGHVLLLEQYGKSWSVPKGHVEEGEEFGEAALRELKEETSIDMWSGEFFASGLNLLGPTHRYKRESMGGAKELKTIYLFPLFIMEESIDNLVLKSDDPAITNYQWIAQEHLKLMAMGVDSLPRQLVGDVWLTEVDARAIIKCLAGLVLMINPNLRWAIKDEYRFATR